MIPTFSDPISFPGAPTPAPAAGLAPQPGATLRGAGGGGGSAQGFADLLSAAMPDAESPPPQSLAPALAALPGVAEHSDGLVAQPGGTIVADIGTGLPPKPGSILPVLPLPFAGKGAALSDSVPEATPEAPAEAPSQDPSDPIAIAATDPNALTQADIAVSDEPSTQAPDELPAVDPFAPESAATPPNPAPSPAVIAALIPAVQTAPVPATAPAPTARVAVRAPTATAVGTALAGLPQANLGVDLPFDAAPAPLASEDPAPDPLALSAEPAAAPASPASAAPAAPQLAAAPASVPSAPIAEQADPRAPAVNQESAIAAVGEIREALRAARPEMTLRHAEFGFVSLRIEPTGTQDWRAVLASRDPGFVPAIQTALAERAVAAASDTASTNTGQNGTSDQRYGASPNGGQGSSQPYLGHSHYREQGGSAHPHSQRQPSTTDAVAGRAGAAEAERPDPQQRGVFA